MVVEGLLSVAFGAECAACSTPIDRPLQGPVCAACWAAVRLFAPEATDRRPHPSGRHRPRPVDRESAAGPYDGALRAIIHAFKYDRRRSLARPLAALIRQRCDPALREADVCVPVPLHWRRQWQRGFNQAAELARHLDLPLAFAVRRRRQTAVQASLHAGDRRDNVAGAFAARRLVGVWRGGPDGPRRWRIVRGARALRGLRVVLVDDVTTTGATLDACAAVLKAAGARDVRAVTIARVAARSG